MVPDKKGKGKADKEPEHTHTHAQLSLSLSLSLSFSLSLTRIKRAWAKRARSPNHPAQLLPRRSQPKSKTPSLLVRVKLPGNETLNPKP